MDEFHERHLLRLKLGLPDEYIFKQCDEGEEILAESIVTGDPANIVDDNPRRNSIKRKSSLCSS
jgi:hypothetical protein